jgi:hypothetical protein
MSDSVKLHEMTHPKTYWLFLFTSFAIAGAAQTPTDNIYKNSDLWKVEKVNDVSKSPSLTAFIEKLNAAIKTKNKSQLLAMVDDSVKFSFGEDAGKQAFIDLWQLTKNDSKIWPVLNRLVKLGGAFIGDETHIVFPYIQAANLPDGADPYFTYVITGADVNVRETPSLTGKIVGTLSYAIVRGHEGKEDPSSVMTEQWTHILTYNAKISGWVFNDYLYGMLDYRMIVAKKNDQWMIDVLIAGD